MIVKGDKIKLVKATEDFTEVGKVYDVVDVIRLHMCDLIFFDDGNEDLACISSDEFKKYFKKVEPKSKYKNLKVRLDDCKTGIENRYDYKVGDIVELTIENDVLYPMKKKNRYKIMDIQSNIVYLMSVNNPKITKESIAISKEAFEEFFKVVDSDNNDSKDVDKNNSSSTFKPSAKCVEDILKASKFIVYKAFDKCTVVMCQLPNGYVIVEYSACVSPNDYDEKIGVDACMNRIKSKILEMEAYRLSNELNNKRGI